LKEAGELRDPDKLAQAEAAYRKAVSPDPLTANMRFFGAPGRISNRTSKIDPAI
jgi:hypothetical protein